jgi:hypothetical protein
MKNTMCQYSTSTFIETRICNLHRAFRETPRFVVALHAKLMVWPASTVCVLMAPFARDVVEQSVGLKYTLQPHDLPQLRLYSTLKDFKHKSVYFQFNLQKPALGGKTIFNFYSPHQILTRVCIRVYVSCGWVTQVLTFSGG